MFGADAGALVLLCAPGHHPPLWSKDPWMQLDVGLDHLLCWSHGSGNGALVVTDVNL